MIHVIAPGFTSSFLGGGGTSLFRGVAVAAARIDAVKCYEILAAELEIVWKGTRTIEVESYRNADALLKGIKECISPGDIVIKFSGVDWGRDPAIDLWLCESKRAAKFHVLYADADGPSRLPFLMRHASYLPRVLDSFDGVLLFGGGARAVHEYASMTKASVETVSMALSSLSLLAHTVAPPPPEWDIVLVVGQDSARENETLDLIRECRASGYKPRIAAIGGGIFPGDATVNYLPSCDALELSPVYARSRFTLNVLRYEARGYSHVPSCRLFEAAMNGSVIITEPFPGLSAYLAPDSECLVFRTGRDIGEMQSISENRRDQILRSARTRVCAEAQAATDRFVDIVERVT